MCPTGTPTIQAGLGGGDFGGLAALEGTKSMSCGVRATDPRACDYVAAPGYGNDWDQRFESVAFPVSGDVQISFKIYHDSAVDQDTTYLEYLSVTGSWNRLATYEGRVYSFESHSISNDSLRGSAKIRFRFLSDWGDCDGDWTATVGPPFGDYTALFDGATVLQEDSLVTNMTHLWGFFNISISFFT